MDEGARRARKLTRGAFLRVGGTMLLTTSVASCDFLSTVPANKGARQQEQKTLKKGKEAPLLTEMVNQGTLPPVEKRLPDRPMVVEPNDRIGAYGGDWSMVTLGASDGALWFRTANYEHLTRWDPKFQRAIPNVAESFGVSDDRMEYTFKLRRGLKWSDGEPFTADDIVFAVEDVLYNEKLLPGGPPSLLEVDDQRAAVAKVDDYTVRFTFPKPNGIFLEDMCTSNGQYLTMHPRHYFEQFHERYNPDVEQLVEREEVPDWVELFYSRAGGGWGFGRNPELPVLYAWKLVNPIGEGNRVVYERNPYYWKTDPEGSQLPYIDRVVFDTVQDPEIALTRALNGDVDMLAYHFNSLQNKPVVAENRQRGGYRIFDLIPSSMNTLILCLNLCHEDEIKREIFNNKLFRIGLSHAIDRQEIIDVTLQRQGEPWQAAPRPESEYFDRELAKQYTDYDVDLANQFLDRAGYAQRDSDGIRLGPDEQPISFALETLTADPDYSNPWVDMLEFVQRYWRAVGIDMQIKTEDRSLFYERKEANQHDAALWFGSPGGLGTETPLEPRWYAPVNGESNYAIPWATWFASNGASGQEPPAAVKRQLQTYQAARATGDANERRRLMKEVLRVAKEQFYTIGISLQPYSYGIVKNGFHNVPDPMIGAWLYVDPGSTNPEQYFRE